MHTKLQRTARNPKLRIVSMWFCNHMVRKVSFSLLESRSADRPAASAPTIVGIAVAEGEFECQGLGSYSGWRGRQTRPRRVRDRRPDPF